MNVKFILDTNAYRNIVRKFTEQQVVQRSTLLRQSEREKNAQSYMSLVVSMELLKHFDERDPAFIHCFKALTFQYFHCQVPNKKNGGLTINYIPPLNDILVKFFFNKSSPLYHHYREVIRIVESATKDIHFTAFKPDAGNIEIVKRQLLFERQGLRDNFDEFIKSFNGGVSDWHYFRKHADKRNELLKEIKSGRIVQLFSVGVLQRAHHAMGYTSLQNGSEDKLPEFQQFFEPFLNMNISFFKKMIDGTETLDNAESIQWNTFNDMQLLAAACYLSWETKDSQVPVILVTDDSPITKSCKGTYMEGNVWAVSKYLSVLE